MIKNPLRTFLGLNCEKKNNKAWQKNGVLIKKSVVRFYHQKRYFLITEINGKWVIQTHTHARA